MSDRRFSPARQRFWQLSRLSDAELGIPQLVEAALAIAWEEQPRLDLGHYRTLLERMSEELQQRVRQVTYPLRIVKEIERYLFDELKFRGNEEDYYDPRNSMITDVLDRRLGIPITLSVVYMALADRIGFPCDGVGLPGHFLIKPRLAAAEFFIDPFHRGEVLFQADCAVRLQQVYGRPMALRAEYLEPLPVRRVLERMLMNLKLIYLRQGDTARALAAIERLLLLYPQAPLQLRDRGLLYYQLERFIEARVDLEAYLATAPTAEDASIIASIVAELQEL